MGSNRRFLSWAGMAAAWKHLVVDKGQRTLPAPPEPVSHWCMALFRRRNRKNVGGTRAVGVTEATDVLTEPEPAPEEPLQRRRTRWWRSWLGLSMVWKVITAAVPVAALYVSVASAVNWWPFLQPPDVRIDVAASRLNSAGADDPRDEYLCLVNEGDREVSLTGWVLRNAHSDVNTLPAFSLATGEGVRVHPGTGSNSPTDLFGDNGSPQWNNDGGSVTLLDADGRIIDNRPYGPSKEQSSPAGPCGAA